MFECRQAAETLLCLNTTPEPQQPPAEHKEEPEQEAAVVSVPEEDMADLEAPNEDAAGDTIFSPLQALVQDIMQQQKKRAQVNTAIEWTMPGGNSSL